MAIKACESFLRISPNDPWLHSFLGILGGARYLARNYEKAAELARLAIQRAPTCPTGWRLLANALGHLSRWDEARASLRFRNEAVLQHYLKGLQKAGWHG